MPVSLKEVALRAGVARGTVSTVLNNRAAQARISAETQERIRKIAAELGYRPNRLAQGLGRGRTNIIGLMIPGLRNPFFLSLLEEAEDRAFQAGYDVIPDSAFQLRASYKLEARLSGWPVDAVLIWARPDRTLADFLGGWRQDCPVVYLGYVRGDGADYVAIDRESGVRQAMDHLRGRGYRRIGYVYPWEDLQPVDSRYDVYATICGEIGQPPIRILLETLEGQTRMSSITHAGLREAGLKTGLLLAQQAQKDRPDAVLCHNDLVAVGVFNGLRRGGLRVPEDIGVVGFDGIEEGQYLDKPLTTVISPGDALVEAAFEIVAKRLAAGAHAGAPCEVVLSSAIREGQTT